MIAYDPNYTGMSSAGGVFVVSERNATTAETPESAWVVRTDVRYVTQGSDAPQATVEDAIEEIADDPEPLPMERLPNKRIRARIGYGEAILPRSRSPPN